MRRIHILLLLFFGLGSQALAQSNFYEDKVMAQPRDVIEQIKKILGH
ncbi:MAG: hypothetical protein ACREPG_00870 [Candidatus Binatia bacterium]